MVTPRGTTSKVCVVGTGAFGTVLGLLIAERGARTVLLCRDPDEAKRLRAERENRRFLPDVPLPQDMAFTADPAEAIDGARLVILAPPAQRLRENLAWIGPALPAATGLLCASKGIEVRSGLRMSEVIREALGPRPGVVLTLSGPNLSGEIAGHLPAAAVVAGPPEAEAGIVRVQEVLSSDRFRTYGSHDQIGVELGGALKNVIAIACGIGDGLGFGHNARAALLTRGLAEITRLVVACGGDARTMSGLAGVGDLMTTVASSASRNYSLGVALGRGERLADYAARSVHIAEGVPTTRAAVALGERLGVELPIAQQLRAVLDEECTPLAGATALMRRALVAE
ncbi:MAG TPA: NAD(P)H-dependent glycerol-3-phosphate dehydrogenase [Dehalococcoidia bacterium]|nr:NAD(P)H-dependent glycerol-3-phosphate dehydrogenase [Dehalococcoidia bacterium]